MKGSKGLFPQNIPQFPAKSQVRPQHHLLKSPSRHNSHIGAFLHHARLNRRGTIDGKFTRWPRDRTYRKYVDQSYDLISPHLPTIRVGKYSPPRFPLLPLLLTSRFTFGAGRRHSEANLVKFRPEVFSKESANGVIGGDQDESRGHSTRPA